MEDSAWHITNELLESVPGDILRPDSAPLAISHGLAYMIYICSAIEYLESLGFIHGDISHGNIGYSTLDQCWKLFDFDLAAELDKNGQVIDLGPVGTKGYLAP